MISNPESGAYNLLTNCLDVKENDSVLLVLEPTDELYDFDVGRVFQECLANLGARVTVVTPSLITDPAQFPATVARSMENCNHTLFLSRVGDYVRFIPLPGTGSRATGYALNLEMLEAPYATIDNLLMRELQLKLEHELMAAEKWQIQCPLGTCLLYTSPSPRDS